MVSELRENTKSVRIKRFSKPRPASRRILNNRVGISPVISTVILSSTLLIILAIATFVSGNILELRMENTEFEQAKMNMMLLDEVVQDVGLKHGSGGYVQFNLRSGGLSIIENADKIKVFVNKTTNPNPIFNSSLLSLVYRGGSLASSPTIVLRGNNTLIVRGVASFLGYLRTETGQGVWIKLDYYRIRVVEMGTVVVSGAAYNFLEITFFKLERGSFGGSGTLNVKAQNKGILVSSYSYQSGTLTIKVELGLQNQEFVYRGDAPRTVVTVTVVRVEVSAT